MIRIDSNNWYRLEGYIIPTTEYKYPSGIANLTGLDIWYTDVEVRLQNPTVGDFIHGVNYKTMKFSELGYTTIEQINTNYDAAVAQMRTSMAVNEGALTYSEPISITESSVICFGDSYSAQLDKYIVVLKDNYVTASITALTAQYDGPAVTMDETFSDDYLTVTAHYSDGHTAKFGVGTYITTRSDGTVTNAINTVGSNIFTASITYGENTWKASFIVPGIKRLTGITATYDGPAIALNKKPERRNIIVVATYSDNSSSTVTDWTYPNGDTVTEANSGLLIIDYQGFKYSLTINHYTTAATQLKAFYNGPKIVINHDFSTDYLTVKIYYQDASGINSYWETLDKTTYTIDSTLIKLVGTNIINVTYTTNTGTVLTTNFIIEGIEPEKTISYINAEYTGPPIMMGKSYNPNKIVCKAYWNNGDITLISNFTVATTIINSVGVNTIALNYEEYNCTFTITGVAAEETSDTGYTPTKVNLSYPEATLSNHRRRGPAESDKITNYNRFLYENITTLNTRYSKLENDYKKMYKDISSIYNTGINTLSQCAIIEDRIKNINN